MSNFILYTYQHTCEKGQQAYILQKAPFKSSIKKGESGKQKIPFLGEGYYLWEENIPAAYRWGEIHYNNEFNVIEFEDLHISKENLLDFSDRRNLNYFNELRNIYISKRPESANWKIGIWIEFFKKAKKLDDKLFPFNYIRADENLPNKLENDTLKEKTYFVDGLDYYTFLSPLYILCIIEKKNMNFKKKRLIK